MNIKHILVLMFFALSSLPVFAANYSCPEEAAFVGLLQGFFILGVIWVYKAFKNRNKKDGEDK